MVDTLTSLKGRRVTELCTLLPCPFAGLLLYDLGAEVTKVEPPQGDLTRSVPPYAYGTGVMYHALNRGKHVLTLNLRSSTDKKTLEELILDSDILLVNLLPPTMASLGLDLRTFLDRNKKLIILHLPAYPTASSKGHEPAHDLNLMGLSGALYRSDRPLPIQAADTTAALVAVITVLSALLEQRGGIFEVPLSLGAMIAAFPLYTRFLSPQDDRKEFRILEGDNPFYSLYTTRDKKRVSVAAIEPHFVEKVMKRTGAVEQRDLTQWFSSRSLKEVIEEFSREPSCIEPVLNPWETPSHPVFKTHFSPLHAPEGTFLLPVTPFTKEVPEGPWAP